MAAAPIRHEVTRRIWGDGDAILLVFAGAAAEFALNRAVDWLFFTGALPRDPIGRLFRTVRYAQAIAFSTASEAEGALRRIRQAHAAVERARGQAIPDRAHRTVLDLLIDYSERAPGLLGHPLEAGASRQLYADFRRLGEGLGIVGLPPDLGAWRAERARCLVEDLVPSAGTTALYRAYRQQLGPWRYELLRQLQGTIVPPPVRALLGLPRPSGGARLLGVLRGLRSLRLGPAVRRAVIPARFWGDLGEIERPGRVGVDDAA
jgi:uncharacterized protein (DUF2236 family)